MKIAILALAGTAVALSAAPVEARHHDRATVCTMHRNGRCVGTNRMVARPAMVRHSSRYRVGYRFGPSYSYTTYDALPRPYVTRYHLSPDSRYVYNNGYIYVVDPQTYAVQRVIQALTR
jgi:hypothetical protein